MVLSVIAWRSELLISVRSAPTGSTDVKVRVDIGSAQVTLLPGDIPQHYSDVHTSKCLPART